MPCKNYSNKNALVGVLKNKKDHEILLKKHWYRIPAKNAPKKDFKYIAFYQPAKFGINGKRIEYYGRVLKKQKLKRFIILPEEKNHPDAKSSYIKYYLSYLKKLTKPIINKVPRRVSFGFTALKYLRSAKNMLQLYGVSDTERIIEKTLSKKGIKTTREYPVSEKGRRFRIDLACFIDDKKIAIECDNLKAHKSKTQKRKDKIKDRFIRRLGWRVFRFNEKEIIKNPQRCADEVSRVIKSS